MKKWLITVGILTLLAGILGFGLVIEAVAAIAQIFFFLFLVIFVVLLIAAFVVRQKVKTAISGHTRDSGPPSAR